MELVRGQYRRQRTSWQCSFLVRAGVNHRAVYISGISKAFLEFVLRVLAPAELRNSSIVQILFIYTAQRTFILTSHHSKKIWVSPWHSPTSPGPEARVPPFPIHDDFRKEFHCVGRPTYPRRPASPEYDILISTSAILSQEDKVLPRYLFDY